VLWRKEWLSAVAMGGRGDKKILMQKVVRHKNSQKKKTSNFQIQDTNGRGGTSFRSEGVVERGMMGRERGNRGS